MEEPAAGGCPWPRLPNRLVPAGLPAPPAVGAVVLEESAAAGLPKLNPPEGGGAAAGARVVVEVEFDDVVAGPKLNPPAAGAVGGLAVGVEVDGADVSAFAPNPPNKLPVGAAGGF